MAEREKLNKITEAIIGAAMFLPATRIQPLPNARSRRPPQRYTLVGWPGGPSTSKEEVSMNRRKHSNDKSGEPAPALDRRGFLTAATGLASAALWAKGGEADGARARVDPASTAAPAGLTGRPASAAATLAIDGGTPVRSTKLDTNFPGPL